MKRLSKLEAIAPHLVLLAALAFFFRRELFHGEMFCAADVLIQNYPFKAHFKRVLGEGQLPLWAPQISAGFPLLAEGQIGIFYPLHWLLFLPLSLFVAFNLNLVLHFALGFYGCYLYAASLGLGRPARLLSASLFTFNGFTVGHLFHPNMLGVAFFLPYVLFFTDRFLEGHGRRTDNLLALALLFSLQVALGHPQFLYYNLLVSTAYSCHVLVACRDGRAKRALAYFSALAFAFFWGAAQLLPSLELGEISRGGVDKLGEMISLGHTYYGVAELVNQVFPYALAGAHGNWEYSTYLGILPLLLLVVGLTLKGRKPFFYKALFACCFLLMFEPLVATWAPLNGFWSSRSILETPAVLH